MLQTYPETTLGRVWEAISGARDQASPSRLFLKLSESVEKAQQLKHSLALYMASPSLSLVLRTVP